MDNDGDVEEEQLRKDILQINQVLGDEDDEGDDSDIDFVIDERDTTQRANEELHLHELGVDQELCEEDAGFPETSDECSVQQLLLINQESQKNLQDLLSRVQEELARNQAEQGKVSANPSDHEQKNFDLCVRRLFRSYFEDSAGRTPPHNHETIQKKEASMPNPFEGPRIKWKKDQEETLAEGIKTDGLKRRLQPILNRQEVLEDKIDRLSLPKDLEKAYEEMRENRKKIVKIEDLPDSEFVGDRFRDVDWECIASVDFDGERTGEECQLHWQNHLYPTINHETWEEKEMKDLLKVAAEHEHRDWAEIAEGLGTGRTAMQCLSMYQQLDDTFVNPIFSKDDDELLHELVRRFQMGNKHIPFAKVAYFMEGKTQHQVTCRWVKTADPDIKFGKWSKEELNKFHKMVERYGARNWSRLAEEFPGRTQYQLRQRWANLSAPDIKHGSWDYQETIRFLKKAQEIGIGKWAVIAEALKEPGEKRRTSPALLMRFKIVVESYLNWKSRTNPEENNNLGADDLYSGTFLPGLIAFIEMREKQKAALGPSLVYRDHRAKGHRARRRHEEDGDDEDDESDDLDNIEEQTQPVCITARQKALARKKGLSVPASAAERTVDAEQGSGKTDDTSKDQPSERAESVDEDLPSADDEEDDEASPLDENSEKEDEVSCSSTRVVPSHTANLTNVYGPRGLARWLKKIHAANAARAAQVAAKSKRKEQDRKQERTHQKMDKSTFQASEKSTFDVQTSMIYVNHKRCGGVGRKPLTSTDHQLFQAVDPMWLCRNGNSGRPTRRTAQAQERTRQEKLCRDDQRAMFGLLLKVFDVDLNFTTAIARRNLAKSKAADKKEKEDSVENVSRDQTTGTGNPPASSGSRIDTTGPTREIVRMPQGLTSGTQVLNTGPQGVMNRTPGVPVSPQEVPVGPQEVPVGPPGVTVGPQALPTCIGPRGVNTSLQEVTTGSLGVTVSPQGVTIQGSDVEETTSDGEWMTVKQQLKLKRSKEARSTTVCQNGQNANAAPALNSSCNAGLNQNNQLGLKPVPQHPQQPQSQLLLLRNNLTGQLVLVKASTPSAVTHPNTAGAAPQIPTQSTLIPGSSSAVQVDTQNQGGSCLIQPRVPHQMHPPQSVQTAPVPAFGSPVRSAQVLGQHGASSVVISNPPNPLMVGVQGGMAPVMSFFTLPQQPVPRDGLGNVQVPARQVQPVMNVVVANSQQSQDQATLKLQVPQQANSPLPSGLTVTQPALRQTSPVVSDSAVCSESSKFVELPLRDGSKFALTLDQYKLFKAGKLGDVSCPLLTPTRKVEDKQPDAVSSQSEKTVAQQPNNEQGPEQTQSGEEQERERPKSPVSNLDSPGFSSPGRCGKSKKWKPLKRKLHTQDISLLPPNVATLQALTSLLLDRKNLEKQRDLFIAKFERQVKKQQEDKRGSACFKGYLESRNTAQVESSQGSKSTGTPQKAYPNGCMSQDSDTDASSHRLSSDSSIPSYSSSPKAKDPQQSVSSQILEGQMDALRKSDLYKVLLKRFLSLFLWPGLLSSTRIRGSLSTTSQTSYITDQPFVMTGTSKPCTASNPEKSQKEAPPTSKEASVGTKNKKATTSKVGNQTEIDDVNLVCTKETEVNRSPEETMETATASRCHSDEKRANVKVTASGLKRKAADAMSACNGEEQDTNGKGNSDAADGLRHKKRRAAECGAGDATV